jgi:3-hydroxy-3-methylglutaryl CoA synthase
MVLPKIKLTGYGEHLDKIFFSIIDNHDLSDYVNHDGSKTINKNRADMPEPFETIQHLKETIEGTTYREDVITFDNMDGCTKKKALVLIDAFKQECRKYENVSIIVV